MTHAVPGFGEIYTLYAHLRRFDKNLTLGAQVKAGHPLGIMGHTPDFPLARAHLHFEIGLVMNRYYALIDPQHSLWNGANLYGIDPCDAFAEQRKHGGFDIGAYLKRRATAAWVTTAPAGELPDFFRRYPSLWQGTHRKDWPMAFRFSYEGIPLAGCCVKPGTTLNPAWTAISAAELRKGRDWSVPKRGATLLENLLVSPNHPPANPVPQGEVG